MSRLRSKRRGSTIQPPLLAWAWRIAVGDPASVPGIARHHAWLERERDVDGDGLIWIVQPDESGLDASPQFDAIWGREWIDSNEVDHPSTYRGCQ